MFKIGMKVKNKKKTLDNNADNPVRTVLSVVATKENTGEIIVLDGGEYAYAEDWYEYKGSYFWDMVRKKVS